MDDSRRPDVTAPREPIVETVSILLVDDRPQNLIALEAILDSPGLELVSARSGFEALSAVLSRDFAAILLDVNMPDMDGFEVATLIRGRQRSAHTPIIFITAYSDEAQLGHGYALGAVDYILRPVHPAIIRAKVAVFADLLRKTREIERQSELLRRAEEQLRKQAEEDLRRADERLRLMIESVRDYAIFSIDHDAHVASWNTGAERLFLYREDEIVGRPVSILWAGSDGTRPPVVPLHPPTSAGEDDRWCVRKDGSLFCGNRSITLMHDDAGKLHGYTVVVRDVTERRQAEAALRESEARLREADRRKDEFLAVLAHELRNPLAAIASATQVSQAPGLASRREWSRDVISRQVMHLTRLMDDLLDVSRITLGKIQLQTMAVDLRDVVNRAVDAVQPLMTAHQQELCVAVTAQPLIDGDATRLEQILVNLLTNAAKYTPGGGRITIAAAREDEAVVVSVADTGIGIDSAMLPRVFQMFAQAEPGQDRSRGGLGIGLSLVQRLVELHGGTIVATSEGRGKGSTFTVRLPLAADVREADVVVPPTDPVSTCSNASVLIVDDNRDAAEALAIFLEDAGYTVRAVFDGQAAIDAVGQQAPDVVLLDLGLPVLDGYQVAEQLRHMPCARDARLIAVSGYGQERDRKRTSHAGFERHLVKPIDYEALLTVLAQQRPAVTP